VGDKRGSEAATGASTTTALGGSPGTAAHQELELQGLCQWQEDQCGLLERIRLAQSPPGMGALDRIVRRLPLAKCCQQFWTHWVKLVVPTTGSDRLPTIFVSVPDHAIEPHVTSTGPEDE
jgi:hypothetical protein